MMKDKKCIPKGLYCYIRKGGIITQCTYWSIDNTKPEQRNGYCSFLKKGDMDLNKDAEIVMINQKTRKKRVVSKAGKATNMIWSMLWDKVKVCGINTEEIE